MDLEKLVTLAAGLLLTIGSVGIAGFAALQNVNIRNSVESWAAEHNLQPVVQIVEFLAN